MRNSENNIRHRFYYNTVGKPNYGQLIPYAGADTVFKIAPHTAKWFQFDPNDVFGFAMVKDFIIMRLGETYLLLAKPSSDRVNCRRRLLRLIHSGPGQMLHQ